MLVSLGEKVEEDIAQERADSKAKQVLETVIRDGAAQLGRQQEERQNSSQTDQGSAQHRTDPLSPAGGQMGRL